MAADVREQCRGDAVRSELPEAEARALAGQFAALADPNRLRLLEMLARSGRQVCVCHLVAALSLAQPTVSHHLRVLREAGLVDYAKDGVWAHYHIRPETLGALRARLAALGGAVAAPAGAAG